MSAVSRLYYGTRTDKNAVRYLDEHEDLLLTMLDDSISLGLSKHLIGLLDQEDPILEELGLLRGNLVTERGMRIVSAYPLLGSGEEEKADYPSEFFPFLLSSLLNGHVSARVDRFFQTGSFSSLFPSFDSERMTMAGKTAVESFRKLGIIERRGSWYRINKEKAASFMLLDEVSRLAYVFFPEGDDTTKAKGAKAISLCFLLNGVSSLYWSKLKAKLEHYAEIGIDTDLFLAFHIFTEDEKGTLTGTLRYREKCLNGVISSDNEMSYRGYLLYDIWKLAEPVTADTLTRWLITKSSIKGALDCGMDKEEIHHILKKFGGDTVPETLLQRIDTWISQYQMARATRAVLLETDARTNNVLEQLPSMQDFILSHPAPNLFIMDSLTEDKWRKELENIGYDMLGETKGPAFQEEVPFHSFRRVYEELDFPLQREVPFLEERFEALSKSAKTLLQKRAIASHLVFEPGIRMKLEWVYGLYYPEKLALIEKAIQDKDNLYFLDTNLKEYLVHPVRLTKEDPENVYLETETERIPIGPIWKVAIVPSVLN